MEKNLDKDKEKENGKDKERKITFIDRKKSEPIFQSNYDKLKKFLLAKNYKDEKILFRVLYDKIYRPDLYNFILKGGKKNLNLARNVFSANEDKYEYKLLRENDTFQFEDDELYSENNYLTKLHKFYLLHKLTIYSTVPIGFTSVYYKLVNKQPTKFNICVCISSVVFSFNLWNYRKNQGIYRSEFQKILERGNETEMDAYKKFYYD